MYQTIIECEKLVPQLDNPNWVIVDCRTELANRGTGFATYTHAHIPNAVYADLEKDLSGPPRTDHGRHPLPSADDMRVLFGRLGINGSTQVVVYDNMGGAFASRLWWMLTYMGHESVAVLNGGWDAWQSKKLPTASGHVQSEAVQFVGEPNREKLVVLEQVLEQPLLIDSRAAERYLGKVEPIDPVAGHIVGAINHHFAQNWDEEKKLLPSEDLQEIFAVLLANTAAEEATFYCGSGVTACLNLLAMTHAGYPMGKLYVGSWSEWCRDETRPSSLNQLPPVRNG